MVQWQAHIGTSSDTKIVLYGEARWTFKMHHVKGGSATTLALDLLQAPLKYKTGCFPSCSPIV